MTVIYVSPDGGAVSSAQPKARYSGLHLHKVQLRICMKGAKQQHSFSWDGRAGFPVVTYSNDVSVSQNVCHCFYCLFPRSTWLWPTHTRPHSQNAEYQSDVYWKQPVRSLRGAVCGGWGCRAPGRWKVCGPCSQHCCGSIVMQRWVTSDSPPWETSTDTELLRKERVHNTKRHVQ